MTEELRAVSEDCCAGRIVVVTEGGYDLEALGASLDSVVETLTAPRSAPQWPRGDLPALRGRAGVAAARVALSSFWNL
jgi:acetoin utilization deacetylase AcuC-like enzyme